MNIRRHPSSFWTTRVDIENIGDADQDWHTQGPQALHFHLDGLRHLQLARPELTRMYATGADLKLKLAMTWEITKADEPDIYEMRLVPFNMHAPATRTGGRPRDLPWRGIMSRIQSDVRNRMEYVRGAPSDMVFHRISKMELHVAPRGGTPALALDGSPVIPMPVGGGTYQVLPATLLKKKACVNIQNTDYRCFQYTLMNWMAGLYKGRNSEKWPRTYMCYPDGAPIQNKHRVGVPLVPVDVGLDFSMIHNDRCFPLDDIHLFEEANGVKVGVYVYTWCTLELPQEDGTTEVFETWRQIRAPDESVTWETEAKLMLIDEHYSLIKDFHRLAGFQGQGYKKCKVIGINVDGDGLLSRR